MILSLTDKSGISLLAKDFNKNKNAPLSKKGQKSDSVGLNIQSSNNILNDLFKIFNF